jgi:hypothetical protein
MARFLGEENQCVGKWMRNEKESRKQQKKKHESKRWRQVKDEMQWIWKGLNSKREIDDFSSSYPRFEAIRVPSNVYETQKQWFLL